MPLTLIQKVFIRHPVCVTKFFDDSAHIARTDLRVALQNGANFRGTNSSSSIIEEGAAVRFARNCRFRSGRRYPWIQIQFSGFCFDFINETNFAPLKQWTMDFMKENNFREICVSFPLTGCTVLATT